MLNVVSRLITRAGLFPVILAMPVIWASSSPARAQTPISTRDIQLRLLGPDSTPQSSVTFLDTLAKGRPVLMLNWASWAKPARLELLWLRRLVEARRGRVLLVVALVQPLHSGDTNNEIRTALADAEGVALVAHHDFQTLPDPREAQAVPLLRGFSATGEQILKLNGFSGTRDVPLLDRAIQATLNGRPDPEILPSAPGRPAFGTVSAEACAAALETAVIKKRVSSRDFVDAINQLYFGGYVKDLLVGPAFPPMSPESHPDAVRAIVEHFEMVDASAWDLRARDPAQGPWVVSMDVRQGDLLFTFTESHFVILRVVAAQILAPEFKTQFSTLDYGNVTDTLNIQIKDFLYPADEKFPQFALLLRPKATQSCMIPDALWKN